MPRRVVRVPLAEYTGTYLTAADTDTPPCNVEAAAGVAQNLSLSFMLLLVILRLHESHGTQLAEYTSIM